MILRAFAVMALLTLAACGDQTAVETELDFANPYVTAADNMIDLNGQSIRYRETGNPKAPPIILLHGFTDSLLTWEAIAQDLNTEFRIIRPDLPGHGLSGPVPDADYSNEALVSFVDDFVTALDAPDAVLVGNSLGGLAAWRYAAAKPNALSGLVLLSPGGVPHKGVGDAPADVSMMLRYYLNTAPKAGVRAALQAMYADPSRVTDVQVEQYSRLMEGQGDAYIARAEAFTLPNPTQELAKISVPTTVLWGKEDTVLPPEHAMVFDENVIGAEVIILEAVGHLPQLEAPERVAQIIRDAALLAKEE